MLASLASGFLLPACCQQTVVDAVALQMLSYGCTRLEIGLQSIFEDVARDTNRGHTVAAVGDCFHLAKNAGFKVIAHLMPDLPNMGWERDMESFREFFENPDFRTDGLKVCTPPITKFDIAQWCSRCRCCCEPECMVLCTMTCMLTYTLAGSASASLRFLSQLLAESC